MVKNRADLAKLLDLLVEKGVSRFKHGDLELEIGEKWRSIPPMSPEEENEAPEKLSDEDLFWSST